MGEAFDIDRFRADGIERIRGVFSADAAAAMRNAIWRRIEAQTTARRDDPDTWIGVALPSFKAIKQRPVFRLAVESGELATALDDVFGLGNWEVSGSGVQVLFTFPNSETWVLPHHLWHMDTGFERVEPTTMVKAFCCLGQLDPGGGATLALAGSHRLADRYSLELDEGQRAGNAVSWSRMLKRDSWTHELIRPGDEPARTQQLMGSVRDIDGVPVRVIEMTGEPGDVYVADIHTFHCIAPNASKRPRMMLACVFRARRP